MGKIKNIRWKKSKIVDGKYKKLQMKKKYKRRWKKSKIVDENN
jgi:hypothetical protein